MKRNVLDAVSLPPLDNIFSTEQQRQDDTRERITLVSLSELHPFPDHPFKVRDDEQMREMAESVRDYGVLTPLIVRPREDGGYEIIAGHRRNRAAELAGLGEVPVIIRDMDDDAAIILMVDTNLQRQAVLPSEKAFSYKMKLEAMKRQGNRTDLSCVPLEHRLKSREKIAQDANESASQIYRFIRLTELSPALLNMVDGGGIAFRPAVELSYLNPYEQAMLAEVIVCDNTSPSLAQAQKMKKFSQEHKLDENVIESIMSEEKPNEYKVTLKGDKLRKYFPSSYTPLQMEEQIIKLLEQWQRSRQRGNER